MKARSETLRIPSDGTELDADLELPAKPRGLIVFAHGSGSSRHSPRNVYVAERLRTAGFGTLLFDLLTAEEQIEDERTRRLRFAIPLLTRRLVTVTRWLSAEPDLPSWRAYFGASTGAAAALVAAATVPELVAAVVSRGGRPDLAGAALASVRAPTLLLVGSHDQAVIELNEAALVRMECEKALTLIEGATHLFEEPGALDTVCAHAVAWFEQVCEARRLRPPTTPF